MWTRRQLLGGAGAALAMPLIGRAAEATKPPLRFVAWFMPNGFYRTAYRPSTFGPISTLPSTLANLSPYKDRLTFVSGLRNAGADLAEDAHWGSLGAMLTGHALEVSATASVKNGQSFDQVLASAWRGLTRLNSLELSSEAPWPCSVVFQPDSDREGPLPFESLCAYKSYLSWDGPGRPRPAMIEPRAAFERLFGRVDHPGGDEARARRVMLGQSILDSVMQPLNKWTRNLSSHDRERVEQYTTMLREVEATLATPSTCGITPAQAPPTTTSIETHVQQMHALMNLALSCDETRIITYSIGRAGSERPYQHLGFSDSHHNLSHHADRPEHIQRLLMIERWCADQLSDFVRGLDETPDGRGGTLLDSTLILVCPELDDGNLHTNQDVTYLLIGNLGGRIRSGQHIPAPHSASHTLLLRALLRAYGVPQDDFGPTGTGVLTSVLS